MNRRLVGEFGGTVFLLMMLGCDIKYDIDLARIERAKTSSDLTANIEYEKVKPVRLEQRGGLLSSLQKSAPSGFESDGLSMWFVTGSGWKQGILSVSLAMANRTDAPIEVGLRNFRFHNTSFFKGESAESLPPLYFDFATSKSLTESVQPTRDLEYFRADGRGENPIVYKSPPIPGVKEPQPLTHVYAKEQKDTFVVPPQGEALLDLSFDGEHFGGNGRLHVNLTTASGAPIHYVFVLREVP